MQKSVFEVTFPAQRQRMETRMIDELKQIAGEDANIRFYHLTRKGVEKSWTLNDEPIMERPGAIIL